MTADPALWRVEFFAPAAAMPELLTDLEQVALAVSIFEHEVDANQDALSWRVELLFDTLPDLTTLHAELASICRAYGFAPGRLHAQPVGEQDWLDAVAMRTPPVCVGRFAVHGAHAKDEVPADAVPIQVEAGLAFGSGEHSTTQACLEAIDRLGATFRPRHVLDLGCGSAVLAIAAAKIWRCRVLAADIDPVAVRVAAENAAINGVAGRVTCAISDGFTAPAFRRRRYELVLANILADPLIALAPVVARHLAPTACVVLSGFLDSQADAVAAAYRRYGLRPRWRIDRPPWVAWVLHRHRVGRTRWR